MSKRILPTPKQVEYLWATGRRLNAEERREWGKRLASGVRLLRASNQVNVDTARLFTSAAIVGKA